MVVIFTYGGYLDLTRKWRHKGKDWSVREISECTGLNTSTVRSRLLRGSVSVEEVFKDTRVATYEERGRKGAKRSPWGKDR